jgi:hypothetical protein
VETGNLKVTGVVASEDDRDIFDMIRWATSRGMILSGMIRLLWTINGECAESQPRSEDSHGTSIS